MASTSEKPTILRTFEIPINTYGATLAIHITEPPNIKADNLSLETWASSNILASALHALNLQDSLTDIQASASDPDPDIRTSLPILELGAGTALVGLTAAILLSSPAILTDLPGIVPGITSNIAVNQDALAPTGADSVRAGSLDWRDPEAIEFLDGTSIPADKKARLMFAADTVYDEDHPELLERTAVRWLERHERAKFVICYSLRVAYLDVIRDLWERFERAGLVATAEGRERGVATNGDDELLCEWVVWQWQREELAKAKAKG